MRASIQFKLATPENLPVMEGRMDGPAAEKIIRFAPPASPNAKLIDSLTAREREILELLSRGRSYKMMAAELDLAMGTIQTYISRIYRKLEVHNRIGAVLKYLAVTGMNPGAILQD